MPRYLLIDGNHLAARCKFTVGEMETSDGRPSGVIYGVLKGISFIHNELKVDFPNIIVCWDGGRSKARMELYPEYKGNRRKDESEADKKSWEAYYVQLECLHKHILPATGTRQVRVKGVEADDLIGILSHFFTQHVVNGQAIIYTGDHDMHQLATEDVKIYDPKKELLTLADIEEIWKLPIDLIPLYKAIVGDGSDNIKGVPKIGDVRARAIITSVERVLSGKQIDDPDPKSLKYLQSAIEHAELIKRNLTLMKIPKEWSSSLYDVDQAMDATIQMTAKSVEDRPKFIKHLREWELQSILERIGQW